jgi:CheY-like chemotaxis protein
MQKIKVLGVDDEPAIRRLLERGLTGYGYDVSTTDTGFSALDLTAQHSPDIVLLDINLVGEMDGRCADSFGSGAKFLSSC